MKNVMQGDASRLLGKKWLADRPARPTPEKGATNGKT